MQQYSIKCAFCKGTGQNPYFKHACPSCKGTGSRQVTGRQMICNDCHGSGHKSGTTLTCYTCTGVGVIADARAELQEARQELHKAWLMMEEERA